MRPFSMEGLGVDLPLRKAAIKKHDESDAVVSSLIHGLAMNSFFRYCQDPTDLPAVIPPEMTQEGRVYNCGTLVTQVSSSM